MTVLSSNQVESLFNKLASYIKNPQCSLYYTNSYTLLVAVVLSAQANDKGVNKVTKGLFSKVDSSKKMLMLGEERLEEAIKSIGLYKNKARYIIELSKQLEKEYGGGVPNTLEELVKLKGVGRKTALVVLNVYFKKKVIPVDTHIYRVARRTGLSTKKTVRGVEEDLMKVVPERYKLVAHHLLLLFGREVCKARGAKCTECVIRGECEEGAGK